MSELPQGWQAAKLGDILRIRNGFAFKSKDFRDDGIPLVRQTELTGNLVDLSKCKYLPSDFRETYERFLVENGDILLGMSGSLGEPSIYQNDEPALQNQRTGLVEFDLAEQDLKDFALKALALTEREYSEKGKGIGVQNVSASEIESVSVPIPPLPEQRRIVAKLDRLSARSAAARDHLARTTKLATRAKQAILSRAFNGELTKLWRSSHPVQQCVIAGSLTAKQAKKVSQKPFDAPFAIPRTWQWLRLPELGELDRGKSKHRPRNDKALFGGDYPFIQTGDVRAAPQYLTEFSKSYSDFGLAQSRLWPKGTVCITIAANIAETAILGIKACFPDSVVGFTASGERALPEYVEYFIRTVREDLERFAPATAQKNINLETLYDVRVPTPPLAEQAEIVRCIETAFARIDRLTEEASRAAHLLDRLDERLLAKAFRGELVPQDPEDEPAEALLARIREARAAVAKPKRSRRVLA